MAGDGGRQTWEDGGGGPTEVYSEGDGGGRTCEDRARSEAEGGG